MISTINSFNKKHYETMARNFISGADLAGANSHYHADVRLAVQLGLQNSADDLVDAGTNGRHEHGVVVARKFGHGVYLCARVFVAS